MSPSALNAPPLPPQAPARHLPGELGIWIMIFGDLVLFSFLFVVFLLYRTREISVFVESRVQLDQTLGLLNTLVMLTSSWGVATAVQAARRGMHGLASAGVGLALGCAVAFVVVKYFEYGAKIGAGISPLTNTYFMFYFAYTGIHLIHVIIGVGVLMALFVHLRRNGTTSGLKLQHVESGASFWHLVDLLWIVLFALLYLV